MLLGICNLNIRGKGKMPRRVKYSNSELLLNEANYQKAFQATNNNSFLHRMWWDVN